MSLGAGMSDQDKWLEEAFIGALAVTSIILVIIIAAAPLSPLWLFTLYIADLVICIAFAWDFVHRFNQTRNKSEFLKYHGYEILAMIPALAFYPVSNLSGLSAFFRALRLIQVIFVLSRTTRL
jgi:hypothetical protein